MSARVLQLPLNHRMAARVRAAQISPTPEQDNSLAYANWLLAQVIAGNLTMQTAESFCNQECSA